MNSLFSIFFAIWAIFFALAVKADPPPTISITDGMDFHIDCLFTVDGDIKGSDGMVNIKVGQEVRLTGDWINNVDEDFLQADESTVTFNSISTRQSIKGDAKTNFSILSVNNQAIGNPGINLEQNIGVSLNLIMEFGDIDLQDSEIDLGSTGYIIDETETTPIRVSVPTSHTGIIKRTANIYNPGEFINPGNIGIGLWPIADLGNVTIIRGHRVQQGTGSYDDNYSIARYFDILTDNNIETEMEFHFWDYELTPEGSTHHEKTSLIAYRYFEEVDPNYWTSLTDVMDAGTNNFVYYNTKSFSRFTLGSEDNPLPVELLYFNAKWKDKEFKAVELEWETATEMNSDFFIIQRSDDNTRTWEDLKIVSAAGFSNKNIYYNKIDNNPKLVSDNAFIYYRLKQVDFDNAYCFSEIVALEVPVINIKAGLYPNPADNILYLNIISDAEFNSILQVIDNNGKVVLNKKHTVIKGEIIKEINIRKLKPAAYVLRIFCEQEKYQKQIEFIKH